MLYEDNFNFSRCYNLLFKEIFHKGEQKKKTCLRLHEYEMNQTQNNMAGFFF